MAVNPVLVRELKQRMRGGRAAVVVSVYLVVLSGMLYLVHSAQSGRAPDPFGAPVADQVADAGRSVFEWLLFCLLVLVVFVVPGLTAGTVAGERERQTLVPLLVTLQRPRSILAGKLGASVAFLLLLVVAALPLLTIAWLIGGVTVQQIAGAVALVVATGLALSGISLACSCVARRVQSATVLAYAITLALVVGTFLVYAAIDLVDRPGGADRPPPLALLVPNPVMAVADALDESSAPSGSGVDSPFEPMKTILDDHLFAGVDLESLEGRSGLDATGGEATGLTRADPVTVSRAGPPLWSQSVALLAVSAAVFLFLAARRLRTPV